MIGSTFLDQVTDCCGTGRVVIDYIPLMVGKVKGKELALLQVSKRFSFMTSRMQDTGCRRQDACFLMCQLGQMDRSCIGDKSKAVK